jgi:uncharacterized protein YndB with AHSA1/START domain
MRTASWMQYIAADRARIWRYLTDPALTPSYYFGMVVRSTWQPGAPIEYRVPGGRAGASIEGCIVHVDPGRALVHSLGEADAWVSWTVDEIEPGWCRVVLTHDELDPVDDGAHWVLLLSRLKTALETGRSTSRAPDRPPDS